MLIEETQLDRHNVIQELAPEDWKLDEIQGLDKISKKHLCMCWMHAKKADADSISLPYQEG